MGSISVKMSFFQAFFFSPWGWRWVELPYKIRGKKRVDPIWFYTVKKYQADGKILN